MAQAVRGSPDNGPAMTPPATNPDPPTASAAADLLAVLALGRADRLVFAERLEARPGRTAAWPTWVPADLVTALSRAGVREPWVHQVAAAEHAHSGRHVVVATGTASGKSLAFTLPALASVHAGSGAPDGRGATVLYVSPTKALAADQLRALDGLELPWLRAATYDGDTPAEERTWVRRHANYVLTNPDLLHHSLLPGHEVWAGFLRRLSVIVIDELHAYRGVLGAHVAAVVRRLRRIAEHYGAHPVVITASATIANPAQAAGRLVGDEVAAVVDDASPSPVTTIAFWQPPLLADGRSRRSAVAESAELLAGVARSGRQGVAFARSRVGVEVLARLTREELGAGETNGEVAAYRSGYLPEERRALEAGLRAGRIRALASTSALELGIDVSGLDAVVVCGWPGTRASLWQQLGRAGRGDAPALGILVARDDPLDTYLVQHPRTLLTDRVEAAVFDPTNPYVLGGHLAAAAAEAPLTPDDAVRWFGPTAISLLDDLAARGLLRRRPTGWYWTRAERASSLVDLRGAGPSVRIVEDGTGRLLGTVDVARAPATVHPGAVYVHQGIEHVVTGLDLEEAVAWATVTPVDHSTQARSVSEISIVERAESRHEGTLHRGRVEVTSQVVSFVRRGADGVMLGEEPLTMPLQRLETQAVWWTLPDADVEASGLAEADVPGAAHAAEHASIGLLPLFATCDRWDLGGVSTARHPDTGVLTVFVYDGFPGGAGFAERGFHVAADWLTATRDLIADCACDSGCPSCVQSPKCGNGNEPLNKAGAVMLLDVLLSRLATPPAH